MQHILAVNNFRHSMQRNGCAMSTIAASLYAAIYMDSEIKNDCLSLR